MPSYKTASGYGWHTLVDSTTLKVDIRLDNIVRHPLQNTQTNKQIKATKKGHGGRK